MSSSALRGKVVLVTGGTGSFGSNFIHRVLADHDPAAIRVYSPDRTLAINTDKAVNPVNLYGATKLCAEKIVSQGQRIRRGLVRTLRLGSLSKRPG